MEKELGTFRRTTREDFKHDWKYVLIPIILFWMYRVELLVQENNSLKDAMREVGIKYFILWAIMYAIIYYAIPPDFTYTIKENMRYIIFYFPNGSLELISKSFKISKKTLKHLELKDKEVKQITRIPYNKEVLKVLKEIQK